MRSLPEVKSVSPVTAQGGIGSVRPHESAERHVAGSAQYIDDVVAPANCLHAYPGGSDISCGKIKSLDLAAVKSAPGVIAVLTADDVSGHIDIGPVFPGDLLLASDAVSYFQQPVFVVIAETYQQARRAAKLAHIEIEEQTPQLSVDKSLQQEDFVRPPHTMRRGDAVTALQESAHVISGRMELGGQEHFYLEGQVSLCVPAEEGGMLVYTSSQHPSEIQKIVAEVLAVPFSYVTTEMRRMGGGFGGKETQAAQWACLAALAATHTGRAVKLRLSRADDFILTGKRHPFMHEYQIGFDEQGLIEALDLQINGICGVSADLSEAIVDRAMFHCDNAYYYPQATIVGNRCRTNTVSHTAFRGFGAPQGILIAERMVDDIARALGKDALDVRKANIYREGRDQTVYGQSIDGDLMATIVEQLEQSSDYRARREAITAFNQQQPLVRKGLALTPVKFGISFTAQHLNQAGALIHIYTDGSVHLNHGGTEMGQGLNTKVAQVVAAAFAIDSDQVFCSAARTDKVPNTSPTAASSGTDLNGMAALNAAQRIKQRLQEFVAEHFSVALDSIEFANNQVTYGGDNINNGGRISFVELAQLAYLHRISLSANGFYSTPKIYYDRQTASGRPFFYFACGAAVSEVLVDGMTGEYRVTHVDVLHDVGRSINPAIDMGQVEGGFIQGMGWVTTEELVWAENGRLLSTGPATYKIPAIGDTPEHFKVELMQSDNLESTVFKSKAVGEPPFPLAASVWCALRDAVASFADHKHCPLVDMPATIEKVLQAITAAKAYGRGEGQ